MCWQSLQEHYLFFSFGIDNQFLQRLIYVFSPKQEAALFAFLFKIVQSHSPAERIGFFQCLPLPTAWRFFEYVLQQALVPEQEEFSHQLFNLIPEAYSDEVLTSLRKALYTLDEQGNGLLVADNSSLPQESAGFAIEQFFLRPEGLANGGKEFLNKLIARYRCILLSLTYEELSLLFNTTLASYAKRFPLSVIKQITDAHGVEVTRQKKYQLKLWFVERMIHGLLNEAINTFRIKESDLVAAQALNAIYTYYFKPQRMLRLDLFFGAIKQFYGISDYSDMDSLGIESVLFCWIRTQNLVDCLSNSFDQGFLYDEKRQCTAFLDEYNRVWHWSSEGPLLATASSSRQIYFNEAGQKIGHLSATGHFKAHTKPVLSLSIILFNLLPRRAHLNNTQGLTVLMAHVLWENTLEQLCAQLPDEDPLDKINKSTFVQSSLHFVVDTTEELPDFFFERLRPFFPKTSLCSLLMKIKSPNNRLFCFHNIMKNEELRTVLFTERATANNRLFLQQQGVAVLAYYLEHYHQGIGCSAGLNYFAQSAKELKRYDWLVHSFLLLENKVSQGNLSAQRLQEIKKHFIHSEESAALMLHDFSGDNLLKPIQQAKTKRVKQMLSHFNIEYIVPLLEMVLRKNAWQRSWQYRLFLYLVDEHYELLFGNAVVPLWSKGELKLWAFFIRRHMEESTGWDKEHQLGFKLLSVLLFHCSRSGLTTFFYNENHSLNLISRYSANPVFLDHMAKNLNGAVSREWKIMQESAQERKENTPLLCLYLLYYSGEKNKVSQLISSYITTYASKKRYIYPVARWLLLFPQLEVSAVIFDGFQNAVKNNLSILDLNVLRYMAYFWYQKTVPASQEEAFEFEQLVFCLLKHWGQAKHYHLVSKAGEVLNGMLQDKTAQKKLHQLILEAKTESGLQRFQGSSSFIPTVIKWCIRSWHYGFMWQNNGAQWVVLCDSEPTQTINQLAPQVINGLSLLPKIKWPATSGWLSLLDQVIRSTLTSNLLLKCPSAVFFNPMQAAPKEPSLNVASQRVVPHV